MSSLLVRVLVGSITRCITGVGFVLCAFLVPGGRVWAEEVHGPLAIRNQSPIHLLFFQFVPERAVPLKHEQALLRLDIAETNTLTEDTGRDGLSGRLDLEMTYANLQARIGLAEDWEVGMDLPVIFMHGEFMDGFIHWFERLINYERDIRAEERKQDARNEYTYEVSRNGEAIIRGSEGRIGLGDVAFTLKWAPPSLRETASTPGVALRFAIKIPSGDASAGFGSGGPDIAFGLALEKTLERWSLFGNLNVTVPIDDDFKRRNLDARPIFSGLLGVEYRFKPSLALVGQLSASSPVSRDTGLDFFDGWTDWPALALSWAPNPAWRLQAGIMENLFTSSDAGADFGFFLSASYRFSLSPGAMVAKQPEFEKKTAKASSF